MFSLATKLATARTSGSAFNFISSTYNRLVTVICFPSVWDVWSCTDFLWKRNGKHLFGNTTELNTMQTGNLITSVRGKELVSATTDYIKLLLDIFQTMPKTEHCFSLEMNFWWTIAVSAQASLPHDESKCFLIWSRNIRKCPICIGSPLIQSSTDGEHPFL